MATSARARSSHSRRLVVKPNGKLSFSNVFLSSSLLFFGGGQRSKQQQVRTKCPLGTKGSTFLFFKRCLSNTRWSSCVRQNGHHFECFIRRASVDSGSWYRGPFLTTRLLFSFSVSSNTGCIWVHRSPIQLQPIDLV